MRFMFELTKKVSEIILDLDQELFRKKVYTFFGLCQIFSFVLKRNLEFYFRFREFTEECDRNRFYMFFRLLLFQTMCCKVKV